MRDFVVFLILMLVPAASTVLGNELDVLLKKLDRRVARHRQKLGASKDKANGVDAVVSRRYARELDGGSEKRDYELSTYSFEHGTRKDLRRIGNDWDFLFSGQRIDVRTVVDDLSRIWDLGSVDFKSLKTADTSQPKRATHAVAQQGHVYVVHTLDSETNLWAKFEVLQIKRDQWFVFRWEIIKDTSEVERLERLPQFQLRSPTVRLQIRSPYGYSRAYMFGEASGYVDDKLSSWPLDISSPVLGNERNLAYIEGGYLPRGKIWVVRKIDYTVRTVGIDGQRYFKLVLGKKRLTPFKRRVLTWDEMKKARNKPFLASKSWRGWIFIEPGQEHSVYVYVGSHTACHVTLWGVLWDKKYLGRVQFPKLTADQVSQIDSLLEDLGARQFVKREQATRKLREMGPPIIGYLKTVKRKGRSPECWARLQSVLTRLDGPQIKPTRR